MANACPVANHRFFRGLFVKLSPSALTLWHKTILTPTGQLWTNWNFGAHRQNLAEIPRLQAVTTRFRDCVAEMRQPVAGLIPGFSIVNGLMRRNPGQLELLVG